ncbi:hypothetical protein I5860_017005 [Clostridioides difficile]
MKANVEVTGLPSGLDYTAEGDSSANTITITVSGTASQAVQTDLDNVSVLVKAEQYLKQLLQILGCHNI